MPWLRHQLNLWIVPSRMVWVLIRIQIQVELEDHFVIYMNSYNTWIRVCFCILHEFGYYMNLHAIWICVTYEFSEWISFPVCYAVCTLTRDIAFCSNSSNTLMKLATGSKWRITSFEIAAHQQLQTSSLSSNWVFMMILSVNVFTFAMKLLTNECISTVWLFLMKIGCFGISMIKNVITQTFLTKCLNFMMCIMFG